MEKEKNLETGEISPETIVDKKTEIISPDDVIGKKEKLYYGLGAIMDGGGVALISCILLYYLDNVLMLGGLAAALIIFAGKIWDAVTDPLMGVISDNSTFKFGRRKPYIIAGGVMIFVSIGVLFMPYNLMGVDKTWARILIIVVMYLLYNTANTVAMVPYCSLSGDISKSFSERNKANAVKLVFSILSAGVCYIVPFLILEAFKNGSISQIGFYLAIFFTFGLLFGVPLVLCGLNVKERVPYDPSIKARFSIRSYSEPFKIKSYKWHIVMYVSAFICLDVISALAPYYASFVWQSKQVNLFGAINMKFSSMFIVAPLMVSSACMFPAIQKLMKTKGKQVAFRLGLPCYILGAIVLAITQPDWNGAIYIVIAAALVMGIGFAGAQMMPWMIFPDTVDVAELKLGHRPTGSFSGLMTLLRKIAGGVAILVIGIVFEFSGKVSGMNAEQQPEAILAIRLLMGGFIAIFISLAMFAAYKYKVTNEKLNRIKYFNELGQQGKLPELSEEENNERIALIEELGGKYDKAYDIINVVYRNVPVEDIPDEVKKEAGIQ